MSDVLSDAQMYLSDPDETVLTAALRNKDDIPILMDIVGEDDLSTPVSQEMHLKQSLSIDEIAAPETMPAEQTVENKPAAHSAATSTPAKTTPSKGSSGFKYEPPEKTEYKYHQYEPPEGSPESAAKAQPQAESDVQEAVAQSVTQVVKPVAQVATEKAAEADQSDVIAAAIRSVLERRLPELVADVMTEISKRKQQ